MFYVNVGKYIYRINPSEILDIQKKTYNLQWCSTWMFRILHNKEFWLYVAYYYQIIEASWTSKFDEEYNKGTRNFEWKRCKIDFLEARFLDWRNIDP